LWLSSIERDESVFQIALDEIPVIPAHAGIQPSGVHAVSLDPGLRRDDKKMS